ncbi:MAG: fumarylacetoacetate hydrolase family protein [Halobacteriales archaeon]
MKRARIDVEGEVREAEVHDYGFEVGGEVHAHGGVDVLPPCEPTKVLGVGRNYAEHADELDNEVPEFPLFFLKPPSAVVGHADEIPYPSTTDELHFEAELGVVIGRRCRDVDVDDALSYVEGYTCVNDVTARDWQRRESQWTRAKGGDCFCPLGPWVETDVDPSSLDVELRLNGEVRQSSNTRHMAFSVPELVSEASRFLTLMPGDVLATGTPEGVGEMQPGDSVEVEVEGVGTLENRVV